MHVKNQKMAVDISGMHGEISGVEELDTHKEYGR